MHALFSWLILLLFDVLISPFTLTPFVAKEAPQGKKNNKLFPPAKKEQEIIRLFSFRYLYYFFFVFLVFLTFTLYSFNAAIFNALMQEFTVVFTLSQLICLTSLGIC